jgi:LPXTG-motif cell wall-anchored protein
MTSTTGSGAAAATSTLTAVDCIELYPGELPPTGGDGSPLRYVWGALAAGVALVGFWMWRRRRKRSAILAR